MDGALDQTPLSGLRRSIRELPDSGIVELVNYGRERDDLVRMWIGEGDQPTAAHICAAAARAMEAGRTFYTYQRGIPPLRQALADLHGRVHGREVSAERMFVTGSGMQAIQISLTMILDEGDELVVMPPVWPNIFSAALIAGAVPVSVPLAYGTAGFAPDLEAVFAACGPRTRAIFVNSPGNPSGCVFESADLAALLDFARARGLWIISDEVYGRLTYDRDIAPSMLDLCGPEDRVMVVNTFSKNWAMTGWRMGWIVGPPSLGQVFENMIQFSTSGVPEFSQAAALAALAGGEAPIAAFRDHCRISRNLAADMLGGLDRVRFVPPAGGMYAFFGVEGESDSRELAFRLVDEAGVGLAPGSAFGGGGEGFLRLCLASRHETVAEGLRRLSRALA